MADSVAEKVKRLQIDKVKICGLSTQKLSRQLLKLVQITLVLSLPNSRSWASPGPVGYRHSKGVQKSVFYLTTKEEVEQVAWT